MAPAATWLNPPNFLGASQSGAQLGAQLRGQNIQAQEAAERMRLSFAEQAFRQQMAQQQAAEDQQRLQQAAIAAMMQQNRFGEEMMLNRDKLALDREQGMVQLAQRGKALDASILNQANDNRRMDSQAAEVNRHNLQLETLAKEKLSEVDKTMPSLTPEALDVAALNYSKTGTLPTLGYGKQAAELRAEILNRAAKVNPDLDVASNKAGYGADKTSLGKMQAQRDAIGAFEQTAMKNIDVFLDTAGKVVDTGSPLANQIARSVSGKLLGSPDQAKYDAARQVAINEVAKIITNPNLTGVLSDSARHEVAAFSPENATLKQTVEVMRLLKRDMQNRTDSMDEQMGEIRKRISKSPGGKSSSNESEEERPIPGVQGGIARKINGRWIRVK